MDFIHDVISNCVCKRNVVCWNNETTHDIWCHFCGGFAARNSAVGGVAVRPPVARCPIGSAGHDVPGGGSPAGRRTAFCRELGSPLRPAGTGRPDGGRTVRSSQQAGRKAGEGDQSGVAGQAERRGDAGESLGWQDAVGVDRQNLWSPTGRAPMPAVVPAVRVPSAQASSGLGQSRSGAAEEA